MRIWKVLAAAVITVAPALLAAAPAEALTAKQYEHQGRGQYLNSTGSRASGMMYRRHRLHRGYGRHHRYYR